MSDIKQISPENRCSAGKQCFPTDLEIQVTLQTLFLLIGKSISIRKQRKNFFFRPIHFINLAGIGLFIIFVRIQGFAACLKTMTALQEAKIKIIIIRSFV